MRKNVWIVGTSFVISFWIWSLITRYHDYIVWLLFFLGKCLFWVVDVFNLWNASYLSACRLVEYEFVKEKNSSFKSLSMYAVLMKVSGNVVPYIEITLTNCTEYLFVCLWTIKLYWKYVNKKIAEWVDKTKQNRLQIAITVGLHDTVNY